MISRRQGVDSSGATGERAARVARAGCQGVLAVAHARLPDWEVAAGADSAGSADSGRLGIRVTPAAAL